MKLKSQKYFPKFWYTFLSFLLVLTDHWLFWGVKWNNFERKGVTEYVTKNDDLNYLREAFIYNLHNYRIWNWIVFLSKLEPPPPLSGKRRHFEFQIFFLLNAWVIFRQFWRMKLEWKSSKWVFLLCVLNGIFKSEASARSRIPLLSKPNVTQLKATLKQLLLELDILATCSPPQPAPPQTFRPLLEQLGSWNIALTLTIPIWEKLIALL